MRLISCTNDDPICACHRLKKKRALNFLSALFECNSQSQWVFTSYISLKDIILGYRWYSILEKQIIGEELLSISPNRFRGVWLSSSYNLPSVISQNQDLPNPKFAWKTIKTESSHKPSKSNYQKCLFIYLNVYWSLSIFTIQICSHLASPLSLLSPILYFQGIPLLY